MLYLDTNTLTIDSGHDEADLCSVSCTREMCINLLRLMLVQGDESVQDVVTSQCVIIASLIIWEVVFHWADWQLLLESINLIQEQDDRSLDEPSRVADGVEKSESFLHTVDSLVLEEKLVIFRNGDEEKDRSDIFKAVNPLLSLRSLSSDIKHTVCEISNDEGGFGDTGSLDTRSENILIVWHVVWLCDAVDIVKVAEKRTISLWFTVID